MKKMLLFFVLTLVIGLSSAFSVDYDAQFKSKNVPTTMTVAKKYWVDLCFTNTGTITWTRAAQFRLGSQNPQDNLTWGVSRVLIPTNNPQVVSGEDVYFHFQITAPSSPGNYNFQYQMLKEYVCWFGEKSPNVVVNVIQPDYEANFISQTVPTTMYTHSQHSVSLTFKNTGKNAWTQSGGVTLGSQNPQDNMTWGDSRKYLGGTENILTGQNKTFTFGVTTPINPGIYNFQWQLVRPGGWFGDKSTNVKVNVIKAVEITSPTAEQSVSGTVAVPVNFIINPVHAEFYVDGILLNSVDSPITNPYTFYWDTTVNHVPAPNHSIDYGYYGVVGIQGSDDHEIDFSGEVNCYTNTYIAGRATYKYLTNWAALLDGDLALAVSQGRRIELGLSIENSNYWTNTYLDEILNVAAPYWDHIVSVEIAGEPDWNQTTMEQKILKVQMALVEHGLAYRPLGVMLYPGCDNFDLFANAAGLDWIGIEAYLDGPGYDFTWDNIGYFYHNYTQTINRVPADKDIVLAQMSYNRNGTWTNMDTLRDLQIPTYLLAYNNPRVIAIRMFAYSRPNGNQGARENPVLKTPQIMVGEKILNVANPYSGQGRRTLIVKATDSIGTEYIDTVIVNVGQVPPTNACE